MRLILQAKLVPDGTEVTKPTGTSLFTLKRKLAIYGEGVKPIESVSEKIMFMIGERGNINAITEDTEVAVHFGTMSELDHFVSMWNFNNESRQ